MQYGRVLNVAIVGGGSGCKAIMDIIFAEKLSELRMKLIGVACTNPDAVGYRYAREIGVYTTRDYRDLYKLKGLEMIIELTGKDEVAREILRTKPEHLRLIDNVASRLFWDIFRIEEERIAQRRQAAEALLESKIILNSILFNSPIAIGVAENRVLIWANKAFHDMFGFEREEEYKGRSTGILYASEEEFERVGQITYNKAKESRPAGADAKFRQKDGTVFPGRVEINYPDPSNPMKRTIYTISDITRRKAAEEALRSERDKFRLILSAIGDGVSIVNPNFTIEYQNEVLKKKFGDGVGEKCFSYYKTSKEPCQHCPMHKVIESGEMQRIELVLSNGRHYEQSYSPFTDVDGEVKTVLLSRDVSENQVKRLPPRRAVA